MAKRHITIPMHEDQAELLSQLAMENGESLAAYVRGRIFARDHWEDELHAPQTSLLAAISERSRSPSSASANTVSSPANDPRLMGLLVEILLHLRSLSNPGKRRPGRKWSGWALHRSGNRCRIGSGKTGMVNECRIGKRRQIAPLSRACRHAPASLSRIKKAPSQDAVGVP